MPPMENMKLRLVVGCGNLYRRDDSVGIHVIRALQAMPHEEDVTFFDAGTAGLDVIFKARDCAELIIVDAARSLSEPGAIYKVPGEELKLPYAPTLTLHDFRWDHALYAGIKLFGENFPQRVTAFLVEGVEFGFGEKLSPPVEKALPKVVAQIDAFLREPRVD